MHAWYNSFGLGRMADIMYTSSAVIPCLAIDNTYRAGIENEAIKFLPLTQSAMDFCKPVGQLHGDGRQRESLAEKNHGRQNCKEQ